LGNIRINKLALELNVQNDQIIEELQKHDIHVKNYMSAIDDDMANKIREQFSQAGKKAKTSTKVATKTKKSTKASTKSAPRKKTTASKSKEKEIEGSDKKESPKTKAKTKTKSKPKVTTKAEGKDKDSKEIAPKASEKVEASPETKTVASEKPKPEKAGSNRSDSEKTTPKAKKIPQKNKNVKPDPTKSGKKLGLKITKPDEKEKPKELDDKKPSAASPQEAPKSPPKKQETQAPKASPVSSAEQQAPVSEEESFEKVQVRDGMSIRDFAEAVNKSVNEIIRELMGFGIMATINQSMDIKLASKVADKLGFEVEEVSVESDLGLEEEEEDLEKDRVPRSPIITIMGHVDHGKTSLLDAIRETNITQSEHGGITQHIGAYQARVGDNTITFLDTPGHEAFTAMRARGAQITDIVILVVAADDGIKPQTKEAIDHAQAANVPIVVAINKIDKEDAKPDEVKKQLADEGLLPEDWGGQTIFSEVSALQKTGVKELLELLLLQAEILELKANPNLMAKGVVIESKLDKGRGPVATVLIQQGLLKVGQAFIAGCFFGRVRALVNHHGKKINSAGPSVPVEILGMPDVPQPGDKFMAVIDEKKARSISTFRLQQQRETTLAQNKRVTLEDLHQQILEGEIKELNLIIKADVQGSIQAVKEAFGKLDSNEVRIKVIHDGVGGITEGDVLLAAASNALIIGFNVRPTEKASPLAARENVEIDLYSVIYDAINDMKKAMDGLLAPKFKEKIIGRAEVREVFTIPKIGSIAGCFVLTGNMERNLNARLIRDSVVVYEGKIGSLRRFKDDVKSVQSGYECGLSFEKYQDVKQGDIVEPFVLEEISNVS
jgi:translation initiation factor IF-2